MNTLICHRHPGEPARYLRLIAMYRVHSVRESVQAVCETCHKAYLRECSRSASLPATDDTSLTTLEAA